MTNCVDFTVYSRLVREFDQSVEIDKNKDKAIRFNVWKTTSEDLKTLINKLSIEHLTQDGKDTSQQVKSKITKALERIQKSKFKASDFKADIMDGDTNIEMSIALHEIMESVKGEADKARNNGIEISEITNEGTLPALPLARVAASIGRKIAYQKGRRFKAVDKTVEDAESVETLYYSLGKTAIEELAEKGYVNLHEQVPTIRDYISKDDLNKKFPITGNKTTDQDNNHVLSVTLSEKKLSINPDTVEANYFLNRSDSDISNVELGTIVDMLKVARQVTQPSTIVLPDTKKTNVDLSERDTGAESLDPKKSSARQKLYDNPLFVHKSVHELMQLLNKTTLEENKSASEIIQQMFKDRPVLIRSLFGLKKSDDFSIDKKESVKGQNLSKTTPLDDLAEYYDVIQDGNQDPSQLHMPLKDGRNLRLYYDNSVLNPHASKQSRYMLTSGEQKIRYGSDNFNYLVYSVGQALDSELTYSDITTDNGSKLDNALELFEEYESADSLELKLAKLSHIAVKFKGVDYVTLITGLKAVHDIRNPKNGTVTTEFTVSADATASGGTLTFLQAMGSNPNIEEFFQRIGLIKNSDGNVVAEEGFDLYRLMTEAISDFVEGKENTDAIATDPSPQNQDTRLILQNTLDMLFNEGKDARELSKDPTMTFVYGQGKNSATTTIARSLADRILDNLDSLSTRQYLANLFDNPDYRAREGQALKDERGLYKDVVDKLIEKGLPAKLYDLMDSSIKQKYLAEHRESSEKVFSLLEKLPENISPKILPAGAVLAGIKPTADNIKKYGMPISRIFEVEGTTPNGDTILTRKEKLLKTVMDVSTIHGIDSALLYHSIDNVIGDKGLVVIHDDVRGSIQDVRAVESEYRKVALEVSQKYDIHEQILNAVEAYSPELAETSEFISLKETISQKIENRSKILDDRFNNKTDALIGDGEAYKLFADNNAETSPVDKLPVDTEIKNVVQTAAESSPVVKKLLDMSPKFIKGENTDYDPSTDTISIGKTVSQNTDKSAEMVEHEAIHAVTVGYIEKYKNGEIRGNEGLALRYVENAISELRNVSAFGNPNFSLTTAERVDYILSQPGDTETLAEFLAVMGSEDTVANEIYKAVSGKTPEKTLRYRLASIIEGVKNYILNLTDEDFKRIDSDKLQIAILNTINSGISHRESVIEKHGEYNTKITAKLGYNSDSKQAQVEPELSMRYLNHAFHTMINNRVERKGKLIIGNAHRIMTDNFPIYADVANKAAGIYSESSALQQIVHTITGEGADKNIKADILAQFAKVAEQQAETRNTMVDNLNTALKDIPEAQKEKISQFVMDMPLHDYFLLLDGIRTSDQVDQEISRLSNKMKTHHQVLKDVQALVDWNVGRNGEQVANGKLYNLDARYQMKGTDKGAAEFSEDVRRLLVLKSIKEIGSKEFEQFLTNSDLVNQIKEAVVVNRISLSSVEGLSELPDSMIKDYVQEPVDIRAVTQEELQRYEIGEDTGWKVLRKAGPRSLGIVYREVIDSTDIIGAYTDIKLLSNDISIPKSKQAFEGVVATKSGAKLRLTKAEKATLGVVPGFVDALAHTVSHNMAIQDSQIIRDTLLKQETRHVLSGKDDSGLVDILRADNVDNPWFIKLDDDVALSDLSKEVQAKYTLARRASNVGNFNNEVTLVRKDISHWLIGGRSSAYFQNPRMRWATRIVKDLIAGSKIGMVVLNPVKIANDNLSNVAYLGVVGVDPVFIAKQYKDITREYGEYTNVKGELLRLKIRLVANPDSQKLQQRAKSLEERLERNPLHNLDEKGFVNSLGSSLIGKNSNTITGLQADADKALQYLLKTKDGKNNLVAHFIFQLQDLGFHGEDFLQYLGGIVGSTDTTAEAEKKLDLVRERLKTIRNERDVVNYVAQYTTSPSSELVRLGSATTDLTDVLAKETLFRHLVQNEGMSEADARIQVLDSFPDYKENMPIAVRQMSDLGILLFPSFWMRIQKVIYRMAKEKPVGLATEILIQDALGSEINTIVGSNIVDKYNSFGGVFHNPADVIGMNSIIPTHMF